jgi:RHS repeat-associated protein
MNRGKFAGIPWILLLILTIVPHVLAAERIEKVRPTLKALDLKRTPTARELMAAGQLGGRLYPTDDVQQNKNWRREHEQFAQAIDQWNRHEYKKAVSLFRQYIREYQNSPWAAEAMLHLGCDARYNGRYDEAEEMFATILSRYKGQSHGGARQLVSKAKMRMGVLKVLENDPEGAKQYFQDLKKTGADWRQRTYAAHWIHRIRLLQTDQRAMLKCGVQALAAIMKNSGDKAKAKKVSAIKPDSLKGFSILSLQAIARDHGYALEARKIHINDIDRISLPAILQIDNQHDEHSGHYWILEERTDNALMLYDPQNKRRFCQTPAQLASMWDGVLLARVTKGDAVVGKALSKADMANLFGGCCGAPRGESGLGEQGTSVGGDGTDTPCGSPAWSVNMVNMNFHMHDIPMWYNAPIGPSMYIDLHYNSQSAIAYHEPFGNKWQFSFATYLVVDTSGNVTIFMPDGRRDIYTPEGQGAYQRPLMVYNTLTKIAENHFELRFPDDTVYVYDIPVGTASQQPFLAKITDPHGRSMTFDYNADVELTTITDALGQVTQLSYNDDGLVTQVVDPFNRTARFQYDADRNLTRIVDMEGYSFEFTYDEQVYLTGITTANGTTGFWIEPADGVMWANTDNYPPPGDDMWENYRITATYPDGQKEEFFYYGGSVSGLTMANIGYSWHVRPNDYIPWQSQEINNFRTKTPKTIYWPQVLDNGQAVIRKIVYPDGSFAEYGIDDQTGLATTRSNNLRHNEKFAYNAMGRLTSYISVQGKETQYTYDPSNLVDLLQVQNDLGTVTLTYNGRHQVTSATGLDKNVTRYEYNDAGQLTAVVPADDSRIEYQYDSGHYLQAVNRAGETLYRYVRDDIGRPTATTYPSGLILRYRYNNLNQTTAIIYPDDKKVEYTYLTCCPWKLANIVDRSGRTISYEYDLRENLTTITRPDGLQTRLQYDANRNLTRIIDANSNATQFEYDANNRLVGKTYADGSHVTFAYDTVGRLDHRSDARGVTTSYAYDASNNLTKIAYSDGTPGVQYEYDAFNRLTQVRDATGQIIYAYDSASRLESVDGPWASDKLTYQYDSLGRLVGIQPETGRTLGFAYDSLGRLFQVRSGADETFTYAFQSETSPLPMRLTRPNGTTTTYQYDPLDRLTAINNLTAGQVEMTSNIYTYGEQDLIDSEKVTTDEALPGFNQGVTTYSYNTVNQLNSKTNPDQSFTYDAQGNMTAGYTAQGHAFTAEYGGENRLKAIQFTDDAGVVRKSEFIYSASGFISQIKNFENSTLAKEQRILRLGALALQERDGANNVTREYAWGLDKGGGIGGLLAMRQGGQDYNYLYDGRGNVLAVIDNEQAVVASYRYDSFGQLLVASGSLDQPYRFSTKRYLSDVGLYYYGYRFYAPSIGRWINRDPLGEAGGLNLYGFVLNNPVNLIDPTGEIANFATAGAGAVFGGVGGAAYSFFSQIGKPGGINWGAVGESAVGGAALGAISGATFGLGTAALLGGTAGATLGTLSNAFYHDYGDAVQYPWEGGAPESLCP